MQNYYTYFLVYEAVLLYNPGHKQDSAREKIFSYILIMYFLLEQLQLISITYKKNVFVGEYYPFKGSIC